MDENVLDMRGRPSPEPLVEARRVIAAGETRNFVVLLTDGRCAENLAGLAASVGWSSRVERTIDGDLRVAMRARRSVPGALASLAAQGSTAHDNGSAHPNVEPLPRPSPPARTVVLIASQRLGDGELGQQILENLVAALAHAPLPPDVIVLLNDGARLIEENNGVSAALEALSRAGTTILVGASCVERFGLGQRLRFARAIAVSDLAALLLSAERVVRL